jgi:steroid 5-alpha reductase family enzyme
MTTDLFIAAGWGWAGMAVAMAVTYLAARRLDNYGIVDAVWSYQFAPLVVGYVLLLGPSNPRGWLFAGLVTLWSLRLGTHLAVRIARHHPNEDRRYLVLRETWRGRLGSRMFGFFQLQALFSLVLSTPFLLVAADARQALDLAGWSGIVLVIAGLAGETIADRQLQRFKATAAPRAICEAGLWRYSRHPNYFFEWLIWVGFAVFALGQPLGWLGLIAPAAMLHLLLNVTGVPATEAAALAIRGDAYRAYQQTTNAFFPGPRRARRA